MSDCRNDGCGFLGYLCPEHQAKPPSTIVNVNLGSLEHDLRIGMMVAAELREGWCWQRKDRMGTAMTFSNTLLSIAGGIRRFLAEWEPEPGSPLSKESK